MSHDELFQYILSPMLNPVSCDKRRTLGMFRSDTFSLLLSPSKPQQAETPTSVAKTPVLIKKTYRQQIQQEACFMWQAR